MPKRVSKTRPQSGGMRGLFGHGNAQAAPLRAVEAAPASGDKIRSTGLGLRESELAALDRYAAQWGVRRNSLMRLAICRFLSQLDDGSLNPKDFVETSRSIKFS